MSTPSPVGRLYAGTVTLSDDPTPGSSLGWFDRDGNAIDLMQAAMLRLDDKYAIVAQDDVLTGDGRTMWVSTVWLGLDHGYGRSEQPIIYETMVFVRGMSDEYCQRYTTAELALAGHQLVVSQLLAGVDISELGMALR